MIAAIPDTADPWLGLVFVGAIMLGLVGVLRGPLALLTTAVLGVVGSIIFRARLAGEVDTVTNELQAGTFLIGLGIASLLVVFIWPKRA